MEYTTFPYSTHLQVVVGQVLVTGLGFEQGFVDGGGGLLAHLPGMAERQRGPGAPLDVVGVVVDGDIGARGDLEVVIALGGFQHVLADGVVGMHEVLWLAVVGLPAQRHQPHGVAVTAGVAVQVVIGAPPARDVGSGPAFGLGGFRPVLALAPPVLLGVICPLLTVHVALGGGLQRLGLGEELLHRVHEVPDAPWALTAVLCVTSLELEGAEAIPVDGQLLLKLVEEVGRQAVDLCGLGMARKRVVIRDLEVGVIMDAGESAAVGDLVVEREETVTMDGVLGRESGIHGEGVGRAEQIRVPVLGGIKRVLRGVQVFGEMATSVVS